MAFKPTAVSIGEEIIRGICSCIPIRYEGVSDFHFLFIAATCQAQSEQSRDGKILNYFHIWVLIEISIANELIVTKNRHNASVKKLFFFQVLIFYNNISSRIVV